MVAFRRIVEQQPSSVRTDVSLFIRSVSQGSLLSRHATAIRLTEAGYINQTQLRNWEAAQRAAPRQEKDDEGDGAGMGQPHAKRIGELGYLPVYVAAEAVEAKFVDAVDVLRGIGLSEGLQEKAFILAKKRVEVALAT